MGGKVRAIWRRNDYRQHRSYPRLGESVYRVPQGNRKESLGFLNEVLDATRILVNLVQTSLQLFCHPLAVSVRGISILNEGSLGSKEHPQGRKCVYFFLEEDTSPAFKLCAVMSIISSRKCPHAVANGGPTSPYSPSPHLETQR
jgi:hypothetical protein